MRLAVVVVLASLGTPLNATENISLEEIAAKIQAAEDSWSHYSLEIIRIHLSDSPETPKSDLVHTIQVGEFFREHSVIRSRDKDQVPEMQIRQWDGQTYTVIEPEKLVKLQEGYAPGPPPSPLYRAILRELGYSESASDFISGKHNSIYDLTIDLEENQTGTLTIRRSARLPGQKVCDLIELDLDLRNELQPLAARKYEDVMLEPLGSPSLTLGVSGMEVSRDEFQYQLSISRRAGAEGPEKSVIRVKAERLSRQINPRDLKINELVGNPTIVRYDGSQEISRRKLFPPEEPPKEEWPVYVKWFLINDAILVCVLIYLGGRKLFRIWSPPS